MFMITANDAILVNFDGEMKYIRIFELDELQKTHKTTMKKVEGTSCYIWYITSTNKKSSMNQRADAAELSM